VLREGRVAGGPGPGVAAREKEREPWERQHEPAFLRLDVSFSALPSAYSCATNWIGKPGARPCHLKGNRSSLSTCNHQESAGRENTDSRIFSKQ
jgi:hypothetical protein